MGVEVFVGVSIVVRDNRLIFGFFGDLVCGGGGSGVYTVVSFFFRSFIMFLR